MNQDDLHVEWDAQIKAWVRGKQRAEDRALERLSRAIAVHEAKVAHWLAIMSLWPTTMFRGGHAQRERMIESMIAFYAVEGNERR